MSMVKPRPMPPFPKRKPKKDKTPWRFRPRKRMRQESPTRKLERELIYSPGRKKFLREHPRCQFVSKTGYRCKRKSTEVHHRMFRGVYYLDKRTWEATCWIHGRFPHDHPEEAEKIGMIIRRYEDLAKFPLPD